MIRYSLKREAKKKIFHGEWIWEKWRKKTVTKEGGLQSPSVYEKKEDKPFKKRRKKQKQWWQSRNWNLALPMKPRTRPPRRGESTTRNLLSILINQSRSTRFFSYSWKQPITRSNLHSQPLPIKPKKVCHQYGEQSFFLNIDLKKMVLLDYARYIIIKVWN